MIAPVLCPKARRLEFIMTVCMWASGVAMTVTMAVTVAVILTLVTAVMAVAMTVSIHRHWVVTRVTVASRVCACRLRGMPCCPAHVDHGTRAVLHAVVSVGSAALLHLHVVWIAVSHHAASSRDGRKERFCMGNTWTVACIMPCFADTSRACRRTRE